MSKNSIFHTRIIRLDQKRDEIYANFKKDTRYEIRKALENKDLSFNLLKDEAEFAQFKLAVIRFYKNKKLRVPSLKIFDLYRKQNGLVISRVQDGRGRGIVWHAYISTPKRARLLVSVCDADSAVSKTLRGRANRALHWKDIEVFQDAGTFIYDLGGWNPNPKNPLMEGINKFKEEFGGEYEESFNARVGESFLGKTYLKLVGLKKFVYSAESRKVN